MSWHRMMTLWCCWLLRLTSHQLGHGHVCLDLFETLKEPDFALSLPPEGDLQSGVMLLPSQLLEAWMAPIGARFWRRAVWLRWRPTARGRADATLGVIGKTSLSAPLLGL